MSTKNRSRTAKRLRRGLNDSEYMRVWRDVKAGKLTDQQAVDLGLWLPKPEKPAGGRPRKPRRKITEPKRRRRQLS